MPLGSQLRRARERRDLSQDDAARLVGVTTRTWQRWEAGTSWPYERSVNRISAEFGIPRGQLRVPEVDLTSSEHPVNRRLDELERQLNTLLERDEAWLRDDVERMRRLEAKIDQLSNLVTAREEAMPTESVKALAKNLAVLQRGADR